MGYGDKAYWEGLYAAEAGRTDEWLLSWAAIAPLITSAAPRAATVLHLGCGNSTLGEEMHQAGYPQVVNIDYAEAAVRQLRARAVGKRGLFYLVMDARALAFADGTFDLVVEKGTLDAIACLDEEDAVERAVGQAWRVLRPGGLLVSLSMRVPRSRLSRLAPPGTDWRVAHHAIPRQDTPPGLPSELASLYLYLLRRA
jgi:SAM-dependent methyltransferase